MMHSAVPYSAADGGLHAAPPRTQAAVLPDVDPIPEQIKFSTEWVFSLAADLHDFTTILII